MIDNDPDHTHSLLTQDVMNERAKMEAPMSAAQFWWNHLTYAQREFIMKHVPPLSFIQSGPNTKHYSSVVEYAFAKQHWHKMDGWPATPMRTV
jgi:hypothetical protein